MVAAAKLRRFQDMMNKSRAFTEGLENLLKRLSSGEFAGQHPFIKPREEKRAAVLVLTSDTGLCGSYNNDLLNLSNRFIKGLPAAPILIGVGKSGITALKKSGGNFAHTFTDIRASRVEEILTELKTAVEKLYLSGEVDAVYVVYSHFKTLTTYKAITEKILPLERPDKQQATQAPLRHSERSEESALKTDPSAKAPQDDKSSEEYIFEPSPEALFQKLVPLFFESKMRMIFLQAIVSEQIARMTAMNLATKNAKEMIESLVLQRNNARQASITKELIEIVSGSQALKLK